MVWHIVLNKLCITDTSVYEFVIIMSSLRSSNSVGLSAPPLSALITPEPVRHSRIPELPLDSSLLFEFLLFLYLLVALFVQYINIYRTVWWYPYSHPAASTSLVRTHTLAILLLVTWNHCLVFLKSYELQLKYLFSFLFLLHLNQLLFLHFLCSFLVLEKYPIHWFFFIFLGT